MKTKSNGRISCALALVGLMCAGGLTFAISSQSKSKEAAAYYSPSTHYEVSDTASELDSYYSSISDSDSGTSLLSKLQSLNSSKRKKTIGYSGIGTGTSGAVIYTDYDLNNTAKDSNGQTYGTKVASFYTKTAATTWNREHVWPNSHGGDKVEGDILHTRPTISSENSSRGNSFYVEGKNNSSSGWDPYTAGYDIECRGECARIILYSVVAYSGFSLSDADSHSTSNSNPDYMMGNMNTLIKWHFDYAPNVYEMNRNNGAEYLQGNRNPFVDHPEYVAKIWSSFNSTVSTLCTNNATKYSSWTPGNYCSYGSNTPVNNDGVTISNSSASISVGSTTSLSATASNSGTISWTTSNSSVASISSSSSASGANITVTGVAAGTATITAKATINGTQYSKTCTVTVTKVVSSLSKGSTSPTKTTYTAGESFDSTGLTITATYSDSTTSNVTSSVVWTPDPLTAGTTSVTGTYGGKSITISGLTVNAATEPEIIDSNSDLSVGDYVVLRTAAGVGVTGWNNNKDATVSETESEWKKFYVASASSSGFTLKDESANNYIASPGSSNQFIYGSAATCSTDSSGHLICNSRYLCKNGTNYRFYSSISSYLPFFIYKVPASSTKTLSSISVSTAPTKTTYTAGEYFDPTGLAITRTYSDSTSDTYAYAGHTSEFTFSPTTSTALTTSNVSVTITYGGKSCSQAITVNAAKTLSSISVSTAPTKTTYTAGEYFDPTGLVITRNYSDSTSDTYTYANHTSEFTFSPSTSTALTTSNVSVTITYSGKSTSQAITVNAAAKTLSSITVTGGKTSFTIDEDFSFGGTVTANFSDSTSSDVTASATFSGYNMSVAGNYTVTVSYTYGGTTKTATYSITVSASGGGQTQEGSQRISASSTSTYYQSGDICPTGDTSSASATCDAFDVSWLKNGSSNGIVYTYAEIRIYASHSFTITPKEGYTITSIVITAGSNSYATAIGGSFLNNCTKDVSSSTVTLTPTDGTSAVGFTNTAQSRINYIVVNYEYEPQGGSNPTITWTAPTIDVYTGSTLSGTDVNGWSVTYNDGAGHQTVLNYSQVTVKLGGTTISIPHTWVAADDGKKLTATYSSLTTSESGAVQVTQTINNVYVEAPGEEDTWSHTISAKTWSAYGTQTINEKSWTAAVTSGGDNFGYDATKGQQFGKAADPCQGLTLSSSAFSGTVSTVKVSTSGASSVTASISVTVGSTAFKSGGSESVTISATNTEYTFTGSATGTITISWNLSNGKALYLKALSVSTQTSSVQQNIANSADHIAAQRVAVKFAKAFNAAMDTTSSCTTNLSSAWSTCSSAYNTFLSEAAALGSAEEAYAKNLIKYATAQYSDDSGEACIERMMKTYEVCVQKHGKNAFMSELVSLGRSSSINPITLVDNSSTVAIIIVISLVSVTAIGGYFFLRKRKEN